MTEFFPSTPFGWVYLIILLAGLGLASWYDVRALIIPKWVSLSLLGVGVAMTLARCVCLGATERVAWFITPPSVGAGIGDGLLFALAGAATGFGIFFVLWILNVVGGGDVKIGAAVGAWLGPAMTLGAVVLSLPTVLLVFLGTVLIRLARGQSARANEPAKRRLIGFALPLTLAVILLLTITFVFNVGLLAVPPPATDAQ